MEAPVALFPVLRSGLDVILVVAELLLGTRQAVKRGDHAGLPVFAAKGDGLTQGLGFEQDAGAGDVLEVLDRDWSNAKAALTLGDMNYLHPDMEWIEGLLVNHYEMPAVVLDSYLEAYYNALMAHLDRPGYLVIEWMSQLLGRELPQDIERSLAGWTASSEKRA